MKEKEQHLQILLDIQKQLGDLKAETSAQSEMLKSLNDRVAIQNSKVFKNAEMIAKHQSILDNWQGKLTIIFLVSGIVGNLLLSYIKSKL